MPTTEVKVNVNGNNKLIKSILVFFKSSGNVYSTNIANTSIFNMFINGTSYSIRTKAIENKPNINVLSVYSGSISNQQQQETETKKTVNLYINSKLAPLNNAEYTINTWNALIIEFINPKTTTGSGGFFTLNAYPSATALTTNISNFAFFSTSQEQTVESVVYNYWEDINNENWYNYTTTAPTTWGGLLSTTTSIKSNLSAVDIWNNILGRNVVTAITTNAQTTDDLLPLQLGQYQYKTYIDIAKKTIVQSPV